MAIPTTSKKPSLQDDSIDPRVVAREAAAYKSVSPMQRHCQELFLGVVVAVAVVDDDSHGVVFAVVCCLSSSLGSKVLVRLIAATLLVARFLSQFTLLISFCSHRTRKSRRICFFGCVPGFGVGMAA